MQCQDAEAALQWFRQKSITMEPDDVTAEDLSTSLLTLQSPRPSNADDEASENTWKTNKTDASDLLKQSRRSSTELAPVV